MESTKLRKVAPVRLFEQAADQIRELIAQGSLTPGERLPTEPELSRQLNVSRASVREALRVLEAEGWIEVKRGLGTFISTHPVSGRNANELAHWLEQREETLEQVLQVRESIEGLTASLAAVRAPEDRIDELRSIVEAQRRQIDQASRNDEECFEELARLDAAFHLAIGDLSGNDIANEIISHIIPVFNESNGAVLYLCNRARRMEAEHRAILEAIEAHNPSAAENAMRDHLTRVRMEILKIRKPDL